MAREVTLMTGAPAKLAGAVLATLLAAATAVLADPAPDASSAPEAGSTSDTAPKTESQTEPKSEPSTDTQTGGPAETQPGAETETKPEAAAPADAAPAFTPSWDQVANIKEAAERLGRLHRARGAKAAYEFIDACYRTHSLASNYSQPFEACIAQDYLETDMLAQLYARMPPDVLAKAGAPTPEDLADSMGRRVIAALKQYKMTAAYGQNLEKLVHEHGTPVFLATVFPEAVKEIQDRAAKEQKK